MPPRKSDVSKVGTGDEGTPAKELPVREGINVEVNAALFTAAQEASGSDRGNHGMLNPIDRI